MKENREFDMLENADDKTLELLSEVPVLTKEEKERMLAMSKKKLDKKNRERNINISKDEYEVSGVERYRRPKWHALASVAACMLLVGGIGGTIFTLNRNKPRNDNEPLNNVTSTIASTTSAPEADQTDAANKLLSEYKIIERWAYGIPEGIELDENDIQTAVDYDDSTVTYYRVTSWNSKDELIDSLRNTLSGELLSHYQTSLTAYLGQEPEFKEIDEKLYFRKNEKMISNTEGKTVNDFLADTKIEVKNVVSGNSFDMVFTNILPDKRVKPHTTVLHAVFTDGSWKLNGLEIPEDGQENNDNTETNTAQADNGTEQIKALTGRWGYGRATIEISAKGEDEYQAIIKWGGSGNSYSSWLYPLRPDKGKLVCNGGGTKTNSEVKEGDTYPTDTVEYTDGSAEFMLEGDKLVWNDLKEHSADRLLFEKEIDFYDGYPETEPTTSDIYEQNDEALYIAKSSANMLNDIIAISDLNVEVDKNESNGEFYRVTDSRFSTLEELKQYISERICGSYRDHFINSYLGRQNPLGVPFYLESDGKLYAHVIQEIEASQADNRIDFTGDFDIMDTTDTSMNVRAKVNDAYSGNEYMLIFLEKEDGNWKISSYKYK